MDENMKTAQEHGNKLTQTINEKGELVSIENTNTTEKNLGVNATMEDIRKEMFEGEKMITTQTDQGLSLLTKNAEDNEKNEKEE